MYSFGPKVSLYLFSAIYQSAREETQTRGFSHGFCENV